MADLTLIWGTTYPVDLAVTQAGAALNLTGKSLKLMVKYRYEDADAQALISISSPSSGITITDAPNGLARATFTPAMTTNLDPTKVYELKYDVRLIDGSNVYTVAAGKFTISPVVVRAVS